MPNAPSDSATNARPDPAVAAYADVLRGAIERIPVHQRDAVFSELQDLLAKPKTPQRGGEVLNKVVQLFQGEERRAWRAAEVVTAVKAEPKKVYNALQYLESRQVIQKMGYGLYVLWDGTIVEGPP